ncbi:MAG: preQ(1) synthase [Kiritimatiellae bacterium]|nr:preQ(1) synthase [Kiritimatiellia bacterium]
MQTKPKKPAPRTREELTLLGSGKRVSPKDYDPSLLESFSNRHPELDAMVTLRCPEFTTLCPITGQPDFGELVIRYIPAAKLVESKSLKLYLFSFRNHGDFHEDVCSVVLKDLRALLAPKYVEVRGRFRPRGGIAIHPFVAWGAAKGGWTEFAKERLFDEDVEYEN